MVHMVPGGNFSCYERFTQKVVQHANYSSSIHRNCSNARAMDCMHAMHPRIIDYRVRLKIPGMSAMVPAATVILATMSFSVSTAVSYTSCFICPQRKKSRHVRSGELVYETVVETEEDLFARISVADGTIADMPGIFERTRQAMVRRCTAGIQATGRALEQFL